MRGATLQREDIMIGWLQYRSKRTALATLSALMITLGASAVQANNDRAGDFALLDHQGFFHHMAWYDNNKAVVFLVHANGADETRNALRQLEQLRARYADDAVVFKLLNPLGEERSSVAADVARLGTDLPVLIDDVQAVSESLGIERIGEAVV